MTEEASFIFNVTNWLEHNECIEIDNNSDDDVDSENRRPIEKKFIYSIKVFGRTEEGQSVCLNVTDYKPHFYIKVPDDFDDTKILLLINHIKNNIKNTKGARCLNGFYNYEVIERMDLYGFTGHKNFTFIRLIFTNMISFHIFNKYLKNTKIKNTFLYEKPTKIKIYETNVPPFIRFIHMRKLDTCGWLSVNNYQTLKKDNPYELDDMKSRCDIEITTHWKNISKIENHAMPKILTASFDIECDSLKGDFPDPTQDPIIMICTVFTWSGDTEPFRKSVITLKGCNKTEALKDCEILSFDKEEDMLMAWSCLIRDSNLDTLMGYNINGFDFRFIYGRCVELGILANFVNMSKVKDVPAIYNIKELNSSGMGDNSLYWFEIAGVTVIDEMKYIQKEYKHDSYSLDKITAYYIKEKIDKKSYVYNEVNGSSTFATDTTYGIYVNQFINIMYVDALTDNLCDNKFKILNIFQETNDKGKIIYKMTVLGIIPNDLFQDCYTLFWCCAKDDVSPRELFQLYRGNDEDRATIAKYCIQDCILPVKISEKIKILNNNIGMANVCSVPLSWLFFKGQGPKLLSLVARECAIQGYLLPVIKPKDKPKDDNDNNNNNGNNNNANNNTNTNNNGGNKYYKKIDKPFRFNEDIDEEDEDEQKEEDEQGYEGATVFEPTTGIHYEPIVVLDYASLYPNSMISMNISHECFVNDKSYLNLPNYIYKEVSYKNKDGTETICTFAQKMDGSLGVIPMILKGLLDKRKECKKLMETTENKFLAGVYDALQLAYKVTANSLYGQVGANVSPIYLKELAASTTATGRRMLELSKTFIEGDYCKLINYAMNNEEKFYLHCNTVFKDSPDEKFIEKNKDGSFKYKNKKEFYDYFLKKIKTILDANQNVKNVIIYGDTDSVFFTCKIHDKILREVQCDKKALKQSIGIGQLAGETIFKILPKNQNQVYEKTLWPLILITKKRYVGNLYEDDPDHYKQKVMGISLKRRDSAKIVKIVVGSIVNCILNEMDNAKAVKH